MMLPRILWIVFGFYFLDCIRSEDLESGIQNLAKEFESAFNSLKQILSSEKYTEKMANIDDMILEESEIIKILTKSKSDSENIVTKANEVVDKIQSELTKSFVQYSDSSPRTYAIECPFTEANNSFFIYNRAKNIRNEPPPNDTAHCWPPYPFVLKKDPFVDNILTNRSIPTVHVPTNVYDASKEIQVVANYTKKLDETFQVAQDDFRLKWQFFCSNTGFFKIFPGIKWNIQIEESEKDSSIVDFFDCRSEQWYLEATSYPKKVMIMVDKSGSMKGRRKIIANHTIYEILNTLTENDYFNILLLGRKDPDKFTKEYFFADNSTYGILMHATDKNKKFIIDQLGMAFVPDGIAEYDVGLKASLEVLSKDQENNTNKHLYNYLLMIISDGSPSDYLDLINETNKEVKARIFTYLIGQGATEREAVTKMACKNEGYAVEIATLADVKENVQKYLNVVARKNALMRNSFNVWTGVHQMQMQPIEELHPPNPINTGVLTTTINPNSLGITFAPNITTNMTFTTEFVTTMAPSPNDNGSQLFSTKIELFQDKPIKLFVTSSKAAFDETNATAQLNNSALLGAAGVDISISEFIKTAPFWKIGVNAYLFGITSNGFVLFHPKFRPQYRKHMKYFYRNVDISELEIESVLNITYIRNDQIIQSDNFPLRSSMLNQTPTASVKGVGKLTTHQIIDDYKTAFTIERSYYITAIDKTSYKFGLAVPTGQKVPKYVNGAFKTISYDTFKESFKMNYEQFRNQCGIFLYNFTDSGMSMKNHEWCNMDQYIATLHMKGPLCALIDILTNDTTLKQCVNQKDYASNYINNIYSEIRMTSHYPEFWSSFHSLNHSIQQVFSMHHFGLIRYYNYDYLSYEHFIANHSSVIDDPLYEETVLVAQHMKSNDIFVARPLPNEVVKKNLARSSLIFTVTSPLVKNGSFIGIVGVQARHIYFDSILITNNICTNHTIRECFLITQSGLILANNQDFRHNGNILKEANCALMESLVKHNLFEEQSLYDFQSLCVNLMKPTDSFSMKLINPFTLFFRFSLWLIYELIIIIQNFSLTSFLWSFSTAQDNNIGIANPSDIQVISTDSSSHKSISSIYPTPMRANAKSKRQHERDVKNLLKNEIQQCSKNHNNNEKELSGCIQKAVSNICRQDKAHVNPSNDQHVEKVTPQNFISHCATACSILHSEYPKVWQEQDDCKQPLKLCRKVTKTFTGIFPSSFLTQAVKSPPPKPVQSKGEIYLIHKVEIANNNLDVNDEQSKPTTSETFKYGTICTDYCSANKWYAKPISNTNLILVVLDKMNPACTCECSNFFGKNEELTRKINDSIENPYIVNPNFFYDFIEFNKTENSSICTDGEATSKMPERLLIVCSVILAVFFAY